MEDNNFFLFITYKGKTVKFKVQNPADSLEVLMEKLRKLQIFEMPNVDPSGAPVVYYFGKTDENGQSIILNPRIGKTDMFLHDYNVNNNDSLSVILDPIPGAR
jgi:hypothetical protein